MRRWQRVGLVSGGAAVAVAAGVVGARLARTGASDRAARAVPSIAATTTTTRASTTTTRPASTTSAPVAPRFVSRPASGLASPDTPATRATPPPTQPVSPWPAGTVVSSGTMQGSIVFTPDTAPDGTKMSYVATITNPTDHWVFVPLNAWSGFSVYLWTPETEADDYSTPMIAAGVPPTAPEFQHTTPDGPKTGLLLAPHGSFRFSGHAYNSVEYGYATGDYVAHADIILTPPGVPDAVSKVARDAGTFTVIVPSPTTTTADPSA